MIIKKKRKINWKLQICHRKKKKLEYQKIGLNRMVLVINFKSDN